MSDKVLRLYAHSGKVRLQLGDHEWESIDLPVEEARRFRDELTRICRWVNNGRGYYQYPRPKRRMKNGDQTGGSAAAPEGAAGESAAAG